MIESVSGFIITLGVPGLLFMDYLDLFLSGFSLLALSIFVLGIVKTKLKLWLKSSIQVQDNLHCVVLSIQF